MLRILLVLPPIVTVAHLILAITLSTLNIEYAGNTIVFFALPITIVALTHIVAVFIDESITKSEQIGYALVHIPFSITFSLFSLLLITPDPDVSVDGELIPSSIELCELDEHKECTSSLYLLAAPVKLKVTEEIKKS